ncbi:MAG: hypothetical protein F6K47_39410 [Symploca sp. SIO2E6]|nr:hypothetical protein [Symploca sp. SIO2E6]
MPTHTHHQPQDKLARAERLQTAIAACQTRIEQIYTEGEVAPKGCCVARYQARGKQKAYWYYKLQAAEPIFPKAQDPLKHSRYKHLGSAGSAAHVEGVIQVVRRVQIEELSKAIDTLKESWSDLYDSSVTHEGKWTE